MGKIKLNTDKKFKNIKTKSTIIQKKYNKKNVNKNSNDLFKNETTKKNKIQLEPNNSAAIVSTTALNENNITEITDKYVRPQELISFNQIKEAVIAVLKIHEQRAKKSKHLFENEYPIFLQICAIKVPKCSTKILRILLPHTLVNDLSDVCLIVTDLKRGRNIDHEQTVNYYKELLQSKAVTKIKSIIPIRQLKVEYDQFELKNRLLQSHDYFLVDSKISGHVFHLLGKMFRKKRKNPTPVQMTVNNLKCEINKALRKVPLYIHSNGDSHVVQVAHSQQKINDIAENVYSAVETIANIYPGQWMNIRALYLKTIGVPAIPIYMTLKSHNSVKVPKVKCKRPAARKNVSGELTTIPDATVVVHPGGDVEVIKKNSKLIRNKKTIVKSKDNIRTNKKITVNLQDNKKRKVQNIKNNSRQKESSSTNSDSSEDEEFVCNVEDVYLKNLEHMK